MSQDRSAEEFLLLLEPHRERLLVLSRSLLRRRDDADDALQEAVLKAWRDFPAYQERQRFGSWILSYLLHTIRNRNRHLHHALEVPLPESLEAPDGLLASELAYEEFLRSPERVLEEVDDVLARAIRGLPAPQRAVLLLRAVGELSYAEISRVLGIPEGTAMSHLSRARKQLRLRLSGGVRQGGPGGAAQEGGRS